jgi:hypothetical protein
LFLLIELEIAWVDVISFMLAMVILFACLKIKLISITMKTAMIRAMMPIIFPDQPSNSSGLG